MVKRNQVVLEAELGSYFYDILSCLLIIFLIYVGLSFKLIKEIFLTASYSYELALVPFYGLVIYSISKSRIISIISHRHLRGYANLGFGIYLYHNIFPALLRGVEGSLNIFVASFLGTLLLAFLSLNYFENIIQNWLSNYQKSSLKRDNKP